MANSFSRESERAPTDAERRMFGIDPRRRREDSMIRSMRDSNPQLFHEICQRFIRGESVAAVTTWIYHLRPRGVLAKVTYSSLRTYYLTPLRARLRENIRDRAEKIRSAPPPINPPDPPPAPPPPDDAAAVVQAVEAAVRATGPNGAYRYIDEFRRIVDQEVANVQGLEMLKYLFFQQDQRLRAFLELERRGNGMLINEGSVCVDVLRKIAEAVCKVELGDRALAVRNLHQGINPPGMDLPESIQRTDQELLDKFDKLSAVDKNLVRSASEKVIDMMREEVGARFTPSGLGRANTAVE